MNVKRTELRGVIVPVITPVNKNENLDEPAFRKQLRRLMKAGVHALFVGGSAGEGPLLTAKQWQGMVETAYDEVNGRIPLLGGVMDTSSRRVCEKVKALKSIGYCHFVLTPSFYTAIKTPKEHLRLFGEAKAAAGKMEMIAYNIPQCTDSVLAVKTLCDMARRGWIRHCKESSGDFKYLVDLIRRGKDVGLSVLAGEEPQMDRAMLAGARGLVPVCANYDPGLYIRLYEAGLHRDRKTLAALMPRLLHIREKMLLSGPCWISGIKYAVSALGIGSGKPVSPLEPADKRRKARINAMIRADRKTAGNQ
jgi:4-hydroxy-tetrahydrodipicolinate synthase